MGAAGWFKIKDYDSKMLASVPVCAPQTEGGLCFFVVILLELFSESY